MRVCRDLALEISPPTPLTRMLRGPRSHAMLRMRWFAAALDEPHEAIRWLVFSAAIDVMARMAPPPAASISGAASWAS